MLNDIVTWLRKHAETAGASEFGAVKAKALADAADLLERFGGVPPEAAP